MYLLSKMRKLGQQNTYNMLFYQSNRFKSHASQSSEINQISLIRASSLINFNDFGSISNLR